MTTKDFPQADLPIESKASALCAAATVFALPVFLYIVGSIFL